MSRILISILFLFMSVSLSAQIGGLSASKLDAFCADVVDKKNIEFEPAFFCVSGSKYWDNKAHITDRFDSPDSVWKASGMLFRFTYGLFNKLEVGVSLPANASVISWGIKYTVYQKEKTGVALLGGVNVPWGNNISLKNGKRPVQAGLGGVFSWQTNKNLSFDINAQYDHLVGNTSNLINSSAYLNIDAGYYVFSHTLQLITGFGYQYSQGCIEQFLFTFYPGITVETGKRYLLVLSTPLDISGRNIAKEVGFGFALTITIE